MNLPTPSLNFTASGSRTIDPSSLFSPGPISPGSVDLGGKSSDPVTLGPGIESRGTTVTDVPAVAWLDKVLAASTRHAAIETLASVIVSHLGTNAVRIVVGKSSPRRIYDHRLGWVSRDSDLWGEAKSYWKLPPSDDLVHWPSDHVAVFDYRETLQRNERWLVWIADPHLAPEQVLAIVPATTAMLKLIARARRRSGGWLSPFLGNHPWLTLSAMITTVAVVVCFPVHYPIACTARVQPLGERWVAAPFEAVLESCEVRPGDVVVRDQVLMVLDGRPLRLERESIQAELDHVKKEREVALASRRIADAQQAELKQRQLARRVQLLDDRLARLQVRSPIDGVVVSGELDRFVGSPLEIGQTLVEIAPLDRLSIEVEIPEFEIGYVESNAMTRVRFAAVGGRSVYKPLESVSPAAEVRDDKNVFVARMQVDNADGGLRPGMQGDATTFGPIRPLFWRIGRAAWERILWWIGY